MSSLLKNTRRRLFSFSKQGTLNEETESRAADDISLRRSSATSNYSTGSVEEKRKPSSYDFLQHTNPFQSEWKVIETFGDDDDDNKFEVEKVCKDVHNGNVASCRVIYKFSDDAFDDYLVEIGLLTVRYPKFDDVMSEVDMLKNLNHSNILRFYDVYYFDNRLWIFTEYCPNGTVEELIDDLNRPLALSNIQYIGREVLFGLEYLNEKCRIVHRDLKCANLLIGEDSSIKIANFEVAAKNLSARSSKSADVNEKRYIYVKSPHYVAPEILKCDQYAMNNFKSDIWSFGIVCIEMLEMLPPLYHMHPEAVIDQAKLPGWQGPKPSDLQNLPGDFSDMLNKCLNLKHDERPSASELLKHQFFKKNEPNRVEFEALLKERRLLSYAHLQERFEKIKVTIDKMNTVRSRPDQFVHTYFDDLRALINTKADEAKQRIDSERQKLLNSLKIYEEKSVKEVDSVNKTQASDVTRLVEKFKMEYEAWKNNSNQEPPNDSTLHRTKAKLQSLKKQSDTKLNELKQTLFNRRNYIFQTRAKDMRFGEIVVEDMNPEASATGRRRSSSFLVYQADQDEDELNQNSANRPHSKFIRIEIKPLIKKRYSIY